MMRRMDGWLGVGGVGSGGGDGDGDGGWEVGSGSGICVASMVYIWSCHNSMCVQFSAKSSC